MNVAKVQARTVVLTDCRTDNKTVAGRLWLPAAGGSLLALAAHLAAAALGAEPGVRFLAGLAGVSGWLSLGMGIRSQRWSGLPAGLAAGLVLFVAWISLNMVRAGKVDHPGQWRWCGYDELIGREVGAIQRRAPGRRGP